MHVDHHEFRGSTVVLFEGTGVTELPQSAIGEFVADEPLPVVLASPPAATPSPIPREPAKDPRMLVKDAALRSGLPPAFVASVARTESGFNPQAISPKGAKGVMQLMPETARLLGADPENVEQNIDAGTRLLRELLLRYNGDVVKALAAYNAGSAAVDRYQGLPPYSETQHYVNKVIRGYLDDSSRESASAR